MQVELFAIHFSKVISKSSKYRLYSLTIKVKTLIHSTREAALTKGVMLTQKPKVWSPIDLEKLGRCQEEALKSQTSDTEQNNLVFNSANFLLMRFINFGTIPEGYNDSISLQSNSIFQVNLNMMYNHAPESFVPDYMLLLT